MAGGRAPVTTDLTRCATRKKIKRLNAVQCREMCKAQKRHETNVPASSAQVFSPSTFPMHLHTRGASKICLVEMDVAGGRAPVTTDLTRCATRKKIKRLNAVQCHIYMCFVYFDSISHRRHEDTRKTIGIWLRPF